MNIQNHNISEGVPAFIIAEVAQAHDGSLGMAHAYIDAAAEAGADAVKFQTHIAAAESTLDEPFRVRFSCQDPTRYDYWKRMEFTFEQWQGLAAHAKEKNLIFLSSPFSLQAVNLLQKLDMAAWKIGSGESVSGDILNAVMNTGKPLLVSTGMSTWQEIDAMVERFNQRSTQFALLQCTSKYPVKLSEVGLNIIQEMKERYKCPTGLSDHSGSVFPSLAALVLGANIIEAHIVFDKRMFGPDTLASLSIEEFKLLAKGRDALQSMLSRPVDKDNVAASMTEMRSTFGKSLATACDLPAETILTNDLLVTKKPGTGIPAHKKHELLGRKLVREVSMKRLLRWEDLDG